MLTLTSKVARPSLIPRRYARSPKRSYCLLYPPALGNKHEEVTIYVKGFLARGESADDFNPWFGSHRVLTMSEEKKWGPHVAAFRWQNGVLPLPLPLVSGALMGYRLLRLGTGVIRLTPMGLLAGAGVDVALYTALLAAEFYKAEKSIAEQSVRLAETIANLHLKHKKVRIVGHSLGCRLVYHAAHLLPEDKKPHEIHFMAPAFTELEVGPNLDSLAQGNVSVYHNQDDYILSLLYTSVTGGSRAVGCSGLINPYTKAKAVDTTSHFSWLVHGEYRNEFHKFVL